MIGILLTILKILGITVLVILGTVLVLLILVLTVPVRYRISAHRKTEEEAPVVVLVRISWLLHILNGAFFYPGAWFRIRVFCFTLFRSDKEKKPRKPSKTNEERKEADRKKQEAAARKQETDRKKQEADAKKKETDAKKKEAGSDREVSAIREDLKEENRNADRGQDAREENNEYSGMSAAQDAALEEDAPEEKRSISDFFKKLFSVLKNIKYTISQICDKIRHIVNNIQYYLEIIKSDTFRRAWTVCSKEVQTLLKKLLPGKFTGQLRIGTGDPASTGQILAVYGILYPLLGNHIDVVPDFEQQIVEGELFIKGKITVFRIIRTAGIIYFNKDLRRLIKQFKREAA